MTGLWEVDALRFDELTEESYNPPSIASPADEKCFDREFEAHFIAVKCTLRSCGYVEAYDDDIPAEGPHYYLVEEHGGDRTLGIELLHSVMAREASKWIPRVQQQLARMPPAYQVIVSTDFNDPDGLKLLPGFACLLIRLDGIYAYFSTPAMAEFFKKHGDL